MSKRQKLSANQSFTNTSSPSYSSSNSAAYTEISRLSTQLRNDKVRNRRQAGTELIQKLSDTKFTSKLQNEASTIQDKRKTRNAINTLWRILIHNALYAANLVLKSTRKTKLSKEDIELPFRLLQLCDGSIQHHLNDPQTFIHGRGSRMSGKEVQELLSYCFDLLTNEKVLEIADMMALRMLAYLVSSPHYVCHFRFKEDINDVLVEIEKRLLPSFDSPREHHDIEPSSEALALTASAFSGFVRVLTCILGIGMHAYIKPCLQILSKCFRVHSQHESILFSSATSSKSNSSTLTLNSIQKLFTVATYLMAAHPEDSVASIAIYGKDLLVFARKYYARAHGSNKNEITEYFSAHL